jgi:hypothetical protein
MALKPVTSDFNGTYKGYLIQTDNGCVSAHDAQTHAVDINDDGMMFMTTDALMRAYGDTHALNIAEAEDGKAWPANIHVTETKLGVIALSMTCLDVSRMMNELVETGNNPLLSAFNGVASQMNIDRAAAKVALVHIYPSTFLKEDLSDLESNDSSIEDIAKTLVEENNQSQIIMKCGRVKDALHDAHTYMLANEALKPGFMARCPRIVAAALFTASDAQRAELPVAPENTAPAIKIAREIKRLGL